MLHDRSSISRLILGLALGLIALTGVVTAQTPGFYLTGELGDAPISRLRAISGDGRVAAGWSELRGAPFLDSPGFTWTVEGGRNDFGVLPGIPRSPLPAALSTNGSIVAGVCTPTPGAERGFRYSAATGIELLNPLPTYTNSAARGMSGDGGIAAGVTTGAGLFRQAVRWGPDGSVQSLPLLSTGGYFAAEANAVSRDGRVIVGYNQSLATNQPCIWTSAGVQALPQLPGAGVFDGAVPYGVNAVGTVIVGEGGVGTTYNGQVMWRDGQAIPLGSPGAGYGGGIAYATNDAGTIVVGNTNTSGAFRERATIWLDSSGMQLLADYAMARGVQVPAGYTLGACRSVSGDGTVFGGEAFDSAGLRHGYILTVPSPGIGVFIAVAVAAAHIRRRTRSEFKA